MSQSNPQVDGFERKNKQWQAEIQALRELLREAGLTEEVKWRTPCYTLEGKNVALIALTKEHCNLSFFKGALLDDPQGLLAKPGENTQAARVIRFENAAVIQQQAKAITALIQQAIQVENAGESYNYKAPDDHPIPVELQQKLNASPALTQAFSALSPGRRRGYLLHISSAKQSATRTARVDKCTPRILQGKGMHAPD